MKFISATIFIVTISASSLFAGNCAKHNKANLELWPAKQVLHGMKPQQSAFRTLHE